MIQNAQKYEEEILKIVDEVESQYAEEPRLETEAIKLLYELGKMMFNSLFVMKAFEIFDKIIGKGQKSEILEV